MILSSVLGLFTDRFFSMVAIAVLTMTIFHPGFCFPQMVSQARKPKIADMEKKTSSESSVVETSYSASRR
jgi:hypothetical protein